MTITIHIQRQFIASGNGGKIQKLVLLLDETHHFNFIKITCIQSLKQLKNTV